MSTKKEKALRRQVKKLARDKFRNKMGNVMSIITYTNAIAGALNYPKKVIDFAGKGVEVYDLGGRGFEFLLDELITKYKNSEDNLDMYVKAAQSAATMYRAVQDDAAEREAIQLESLPAPASDVVFDFGANEWKPVKPVVEDDDLVQRSPRGPFSPETQAELDAYETSKLVPLTEKLREIGTTQSVATFAADEDAKHLSGP